MFYSKQTIFQTVFYWEQNRAVDRGFLIVGATKGPIHKTDKGLGSVEIF